MKKIQIKTLYSFHFQLILLTGFHKGGERENEFDSMEDKNFGRHIRVVRRGPFI